MTLYSFDVTLDGDQMATVKRALVHYLNVYQQKAKNGSGSPLISDKMTIGLLAKLGNRTDGLIIVDDDGMMTLRETLSHYAKACELQISSHATEPFIADLSTIKVVFELLNEAL